MAAGDQVTVPAQHRLWQWQYEFDLRGRQSVAHDPDTGMTIATYDNADRVVSVTDARGETVSTVYDPLGRTTQRWDGEAGAGELLAAWTFDTMANGKGLPATATAYVDGHPILTQYGGYDAAGNAVRMRTTVPQIPGLVLQQWFVV